MMDFKKIMIFPFFLFALVFSGCASNDMSQSLYSVANPYLRVAFVIVDSNGKTYDGFKKIRIHKDLEYLSYKLTVLENPYEIEYKIFSVIATKEGVETEVMHYVSEKTGVVYTIKIPIDKKNAMFDVYLSTKEGRRIFSLLPLEYMLEEETDEGGEHK